MAIEQGASGGATSARAAVNRLRGPALLAMLALLGVGLAALGQVRGPPVRGAILRDDRGATIILALDPSDGLAVLHPPAIRLILSRLPITLDADRSVIHIEGGPERLLPPRWTTALLDRSGRLTHSEGEIDPHRAEALAREIEDNSFAGARRVLLAWDPRLDDFFKD